MNACIIFPVTTKEEFSPLEEYGHSKSKADWNLSAGEQNCVLMENVLTEMQISSYEVLIFKDTGNIYNLCT